MIVWWMALSGCAWLFEVHEEPEEAPRQTSKGVQRANQVDRGEGLNPEARSKEVLNLQPTGDGADEQGRRAYNPVRVPITVDSKPVGLQTSTGKPIQLPTRAKEDALEALIRNERDPAMRKQLEEELRQKQRNNY